MNREERLKRLGPAVCSVCKHKRESTTGLPGLIWCKEKDTMMKREATCVSFRRLYSNPKLQV